MKKSLTRLIALTLCLGLQAPGWSACTPAGILLSGAPSVMIGSAINFPVTLAAPAPAGGITMTLTTSDANVVSVTQPSLTFNAGSTVPTTAVLAYGFKIGAATITASATGLATASLAMQVVPQSNISVTWQGACLITANINGVAGNFQAMDYILNSPASLVLNATLFFTPNCDPSGGIDNMNDFQALTKPGNSTQGFTHHPDEFPSSAIFWFGPRTADGGCFPGLPCSGCVTYTADSPSCASL